MNNIDRLLTPPASDVPSDYKTETKNSLPGNGRSKGRSIERPITLAEIWRQYPAPRRAIIDGLLREGQVGNIVAVSKSHKSFLVASLAVAMVVKSRWLDTYPCAGGRVLIIDLELQLSDFSARLREVNAAMKAPARKIGDSILVRSFRGKRGALGRVTRLLRSLTPGEYSLIIIDPLYKTFPRKFEENSNGAMTDIYRLWEQLAEATGAALVLVHHATKGGQAEKSVVDVGAGASAQARSPDAHIVLRQHEVDECVVVDAKVRSFPPPESIVIRWGYPLWRRDVELDPAKLKTNKRPRAAKQPKEQSEKPKHKDWTPQRLAEDVLTTTPQRKSVIITKAGLAGLARRKASEYLDYLESQGKAFCWRLEGESADFYATVKQPINSLKKEARRERDVARAQSPHTPHIRPEP
jgi:hypothetical protein